MTTTTTLPAQTALTQLCECRSELLRAEQAALTAADALTGPHRQRAEHLAERLALAVASVEHLILAVRGDL